MAVSGEADAVGSAASAGAIQERFKAIGQGQRRVHLLPEQLAPAAVDRIGPVMEIAGHVAQGIADAPPVVGLKAEIRSRIWHGTRWHQAPLSMTGP